MIDAQTRVQLRQTLFLMASVRLIALLILTLTNAAADTSLAPQQHDCGGLRGDGSCAATTMKGFSGLKTANLIRLHHNTELERIGGFEKLQALGDDDDTEPALVVVENGDRGITMTAFGTLERGGWAALQRLDASALCASRLVAQDETPCYCGDAADDCFDHPDVIRDLTKYVDEDDDDEDDVEAIAPAPRQAPPAGWGKLLSA